MTAVETPGAVSFEELQLAARNHGMPLEALHHPITPVGLHYLLIHYDIPLVDRPTWRLEIAGHVARPLSLSLGGLRARPAFELIVTMECAGNGRAMLSPRPLSQPWLNEAVGTGRWRGVSVRSLLEEAGVREGAVEVVFGGLDRGVEDGIEQSYERSLPLEEALADALLAYELNGQELPPQHGFPLRLIVPGWYGMTNVKWLSRLMVSTEPFTGHQQAHAYRFRASEDDPGRALTRMLPRSLMVPPGVPDFPTRRRTMTIEPTLLRGRAWSGWGPIERVEVSTDGGERWASAELERDVGSPWAWCAWSYRFEPPRPGEYVLCCRAADATGNEQPSEPAWNVGGYANNAVQRVPVTVASP